MSSSLRSEVLWNETLGTETHLIPQKVNLPSLRSLTLSLSCLTLVFFGSLAIYLHADYLQFQPTNEEEAIASFITFQNNLLANATVRVTVRKPHYPDAIIIGSKKSGTRALLEFLRLNDQVKAVGKETHFFENKNYWRGLQWYEKHLPKDMKDKNVLIEKCPGYLTSEEAPKRIRDLIPDVKLIVILRNPIVRAISDFTQSMSKRKNATTKDAAKIFDKKLFLDYPKNTKINWQWPIVLNGLYYTHIKRWSSVFGREQFLFIDGDAFATNPGQEMVKAQRFLGVAPRITQDTFYFDKDKGFPCVKPGASNRKHECLGDTKGRKHPELHQDSLNKLAEFYEIWNENLNILLKSSFEWSH